MYRASPARRGASARVTTPVPHAISITLPGGECGDSIRKIGGVGLKYQRSKVPVIELGNRAFERLFVGLRWNHLILLNCLAIGDYLGVQLHSVGDGTGGAET